MTGTLLAIWPALPDGTVLKVYRCGECRGFGVLTGRELLHLLPDGAAPFPAEALIICQTCGGSGKVIDPPISPGVCVP